jgi:GNAT superfamily N-acetyltransferase
MQHDWTVRYYRDGDDQGILDCLTAAFGTWPSVDIDVAPTDHLRWKLSSDPQGRYFSYVAEAAGKIIGCQGIVVQRLKDGPRQLLADTCTDYAVHPDWQGSGVSQAIWNFDAARFTATFDVLVGITDSPAVKHQVSTIGWSRGLANTIGWVECDTAGHRHESRRAGCDIETTARFDEGTDTLCASALADFTLCMVRDAAYLNWRFADRRAGKYTIRMARERGELAGYSVLTVVRGKGVIADLLALPGRLDLVEALVADALNYFAGMGLGTVRTWMPERHVYREVLLGGGFRPIRAIAYLGLGPHAGAPMPSRDDPKTAVHFMPGDTDIV